MDLILTTILRTEPHLVFYARVLSYPVVGDVILHVIDNLPGVPVSFLVLVLLRLYLCPVLATTPGMHQLLVEVVVVVLIEVSVRHDGDAAHKYGTEYNETRRNTRLPSLPEE
ncbi:hypothetical protein E2C01_037562 [Portunus trituberculatus]|uniref:Uncharacterized protein n=1 Tax=Portunus trituberculatus TaxID=210409 RepID=A0A5B7FFZ3_PORTR|nr:hypothetical protein [Portunus trituberculatus]